MANGSFNSGGAGCQVPQGTISHPWLPGEILSDNGTAFTSAELKKFKDNNLIRHIHSAPFKPATNAQAERIVQSTKNFLRRAGQNPSNDNDHTTF